MELTEANGVRWYSFPRLAAWSGVIHGIFTRQGGVSAGPYASLNVSYSVGDLAHQVEENRRRVRQALGLEELISATQVHGRQEAVIQTGVPVPSGEIPEVDILITAQPDLGLVIKQADCQAVLFFDPEHRVVANTHCGWRGQVNHVLTETVRRLSRHCGCRPENLLAAIGPGLGPCCAEFRHYRREFPPEFWKYQVRPGYFDLWQLSFEQLTAAGLEPRNIEVAGLCSRCRTEEFFSYRRDGIAGRQAAVIALKP